MKNKTKKQKKIKSTRVFSYEIVAMLNVVRREDWHIIYDIILVGIVS